MEMDVRRIRMSLGNMGRRRGVRIRSREIGVEKDQRYKETKGGRKKEGKDIYLLNLFISSVDISNRFFSEHLLGTFSILDNKTFLYT